MRALIPALGASGLILALFSVPPLRAGGLSDRVEPYLTGLHGRLSRLLHTRPERGGRFSRWITSLLPAGGEDLPRRLEAAGADLAPSAFRLQQFVWGAGMSLGALVLAAVSVGAGGAVDPFAVPFLAAVMFASGWVGRDWWLTREVDARREVIRAELPVAIDLMTLAIVAGESVGAACARVPRFVGGEVGTELARVAADIRAGAPAVESLERLAARVPEHAMGRFVDALCTGLERGAPLGDVLRAQADDLREERKRDLLEMGGRREVLMLVPVIFLIMPVVVVFALLPGLVSLDLLVP